MPYDRAARRHDDGMLMQFFSLQWRLAPEWRLVPEHLRRFHGYAGSVRGLCLQVAVRRAREFVALTIVLSASLNSETEALANIGTRESCSPLMSTKTSFPTITRRSESWNTYCNALCDSCIVNFVRRFIHV